VSIFEDSTSRFAQRNDRDRVYGIVIGIVTENTDPTHAYRVKVRLPHLPGGGESDETKDSTHWARVSTGLAGEYIGDDNKFGPRGAYVMPEIGDEVLVMFLFGDVGQPVIIGRVWSDVAAEPSGGGGGGDQGKPNKPVYSHTQVKGKLSDAIKAKPEGHARSPYQETEQREKKNDVAGLRTRSGHLVVFNDNQQEPGGTHKGGILVRSSTGHRFEILDKEDQGIMLADSKGNYVWLRAGAGDPKQTIEIKTTGDINLTSTEGDINIRAEKGAIKTYSKANTELKVDGQYKMRRRARCCSRRTRAARCRPPPRSSSRATRSTSTEERRGPEPAG
jgi:hypothetical protein